MAGEEFLELFGRNRTGLIPPSIGVNVVSPGPVATAILGRRGMLFLARDDCSFLLGTEIVADGGMSQF